MLETRNALSYVKSWKSKAHYHAHLNQSLFVLTNNKAQMEFLNNLIPTVQDLAKFWSRQCVGKTRTRATLMLRATMLPTDHVSVRRSKLLRLQFKGPEPIWFQSGGWIKCILQGIYIAKGLFPDPTQICMFVVHKKQNNVHSNWSWIQEEILNTDLVTISRTI